MPRGIRRKKRRDLVSSVPPKASEKYLRQHNKVWLWLREEGYNRYDISRVMKVSYNTVWRYFAFPYNYMTPEKFDLLRLALPDRTAKEIMEEMNEVYRVGTKRFFELKEEDNWDNLEEILKERVNKSDYAELIRHLKNYYQIVKL